MTTHKPCPWSLLAAFALLALAGLLLAGCASRVSTQSLPPVDPAPVLAAQAGKDRAVTDWAARIDGLVDQWLAQFPAPELARQIKAATGEIRAEVLKAPATQFNALVAAYEQRAKADARRIAELLKQNEALRQQALREQARWLTGSGVALLAAFGVSIALGQLAAALKTWPLALLALGCFGLAQLISHPWFLRGFLALLAAALAYAVYYVLDRHREGRLKRSLEKKAEVLGQIVPVLDDAYDHAADTVKAALDANVFARLSSVFNREHKATVHAVRAEALRSQP